jgi:hypothetical protein
MRVPKKSPKDFPKEMQGLYPFVAEMRHMIVIIGFHQRSWERNSKQLALSYIQNL